MYYINSTPNGSGYHGNPMGQPFPNCVTLPDDLLSPYLAAKGFVTLTVENGAVTSLETNQEALDAYSGGMISRNAYYFEQGKISDREFKHFEELVMSYAGSITVRSFPRFAARISTMDIKNGIAEYRKINGYSPDVVIVDSMDLLTDATRRQWGAEHERSKRIAVANDLKDLAADENVWMVVTYQSTIEDLSLIHI